MQNTDNIIGKTLVQNSYMKGISHWKCITKLEMKDFRKTNILGIRWGLIESIKITQPLPQKWNQYIDWDQIYYRDKASRTYRINMSKNFHMNQDFTLDSLEFLKSRWIHVNLKKTS